MIGDRRRCGRRCHLQQGLLESKMKQKKDGLLLLPLGKINRKIL